MKKGNKHLDLIELTEVFSKTVDVLGRRTDNKGYCDFFQDIRAAVFECPNTRRRHSYIRAMRVFIKRYDDAILAKRYDKVIEAGELLVKRYSKAIRKTL